MVKMNIGRITDLESLHRCGSTFPPTFYGNNILNLGSDFNLQGNDILFLFTYTLLLVVTYDNVRYIFCTRSI